MKNLMTTPKKLSPNNLAKQLLFVSGFLSTIFAAHAFDPVMDAEFVDGIKKIMFDEGMNPPIHLDRTNYDSKDRGIPDAVMKMAGLPLDLDTDATLLGGISLRNRYRWGLSIERDSTCNDGIPDLVKMEPPGYDEQFRWSPVFFTITEEDTASATSPEAGDHVFLPVFEEYVLPWAHNNMSIPLGDFRFPLGERYQPGPVHISKYGNLEFGRAQENYYSRKLPTAELSGDAVAVAWNYWRVYLEEQNAKIVAGFRGEQRGQRYFFTRWENLQRGRAQNELFGTFEGRLHEDGRIEFHYLNGDFSSKNIFSGAQCKQGYYGLTVPKEKMVAGKKITFTPHYQLNPIKYSWTEDEIPDAWKLMFNINPHDTNIADQVFNDKGIKLRDCYEQRLNPWTGISHLKPKAP